MNKARKFRVSLIILILCLVLGLIVSVSIGQVVIPLKDSFGILFAKLTHGSMESFNPVYVDVISEIRLPRAILALLVGSGLSLCGAVMQASVQNPLADPYILGISSGASLGATFSIMIGFSIPGILGDFGVASWAFVGALAAAFLVITLANIGGKISSVKLVLAGTVINAMCTALSNFIIYFAKNAEQIRSVSFWTMGSLASATWASIPLVAIIVGISVCFFLTQTRTLNTMLTGEDTATTLGINTNLYRKIYIVFASMVTGILVSTCGIIGFVGLIIPHISRSIVGSDHKRLLPISIVLGGLFLVVCDILARTVIPNGELPIGIITSMIGAPVFMYILIKKSYGFGGK